LADGKVVISTALDNKGFEKDAQKARTSLRSQAAKLAAEYRKQGMSASDAMKKAWSEIERDTKASSKHTGDSIKNNVGSGADVAINKLKGLGSAAIGSLGGLAKVVGGLTAMITAAFGTAAVAITKQSVDAYADYEQLIGGVKTLFKDGADKVESYAEDAFYRAGVSANKYMETVTSFSASLISALGGDTVEAAKVADMAMVDMADNVSRLGSELESVRAAYQGLAKQNYTMLDNLKLGYGGTKTEMERLLKDAQAITGVKYDINNLADVYNAIHVIQEKLGIAGATAEEAEKTISGSAAMTKAAWENVLAAISGGGDLDKAINNLVFSISKYFENIVPVVERALSGIGQMIEKIAPQLVQTVATALIKAIPSLLNAVYQMIIGLAKGIYEGIVALFSGSTKEIAAQINNTDGLADNYNSAAEGASNLAEATEEAGKAAQKSLAPFDEITKLGSKDNASDAGSIFGGFTAGGEITGDTVAGKSAETPLGGVFQAVREKIGELIEPLKDIDFGPAMKSIKKLGKAFIGLGANILKGLEWAWFNILVPLAEWGIEEAAPAGIDALSAAFDALDLALEPVLSGMEEFWEALDPLVVFVEDSAIMAIRELERTFVDLGATIEASGWKIEGIISGIGEIFSQLWLVVGPILEALRTKWISTFRTICSFVTTRLKNLIDGIYGAVELVAGVLTGDWARAWSGLADVVKWPINNVINLVNALVSCVVAGVNAVIDMVNSLSFDVPDWVPGIGGKTFGFSLKHVVAPEIPYLAKGAVLPANKPFMAVVGDQRHGTNVEAPLSTIQEAVALVMEDMIASNMAGHEATVAVLKEILSAVLGIEIGDTVIGEAVQRYNAKMAVIRGGK
jgi:phage-related protein